MTGAGKIARALGGARRSGGWWRCRCPVHDSRGATLALRDGDRGLIVKCHAGCDSRDVLRELRGRGLIESDGRVRSPESAARPIARLDDDGRRIAAARRLWEAAQDARSSPVIAYLAGRGLTIDTLPSLRWAPSCPHPSGVRLPAMVARIESIDGELIGIHRTFLRSDGASKADIEPQKAMLGRSAGGAVRLAPAAEMLTVGEGIETCLAAMQATGMPAWAALSTSGLVRLVLPAEVRTVVIIADHDLNGAGERAARAAAARWESKAGGYRYGCRRMLA